MRFTVPAHHQAARYQLDNAGSSGGPWADPFDDPSGTVLWSRWINGSTSGTATENCAFWSKKQGFSGTSSACKWRTNSGSGRTNLELLNWEALASGPLIVRMRCKVETFCGAEYLAAVQPDLHRSALGDVCRCDAGRHSCGKPGWT